MLMSSIVRFSLGIKDHRVVSTHLINNELRIELDAKKRLWPTAGSGKTIEVLGL